MKTFYLQQVNVCERQIALAKVGYMQRVSRLADELKTATSEERIHEIIKELVLEEDALNSLKGSLEYNREAYQKEIEKESAKV